MKRQRGLGVSELMIGLTLGLLLMLAAFTLLAGANAAYVAQLEASSVDDGGRFALAVIEQAVRQAAFIDWEYQGSGAPDPFAPAAVRGLDAASLSSEGAGIEAPRAAVVNGSDVLALRFGGAGRGNGDGGATTCAGFSVGAGQEGWSIFYVGRSASGETELRCKFKGANNWSAEAVIAGIDSFQVLYGVDGDGQPGGSGKRFLNATQIDALDAALAVSGANETERTRERARLSWWKRVVSVRVALLVHGTRRSQQVGAPAVYRLFGAAYSGGADQGTLVEHETLAPELKQRERAMFGTTVALRNPMVRP
jgi:type IV pilus assembly protein PilW